jgi:hypothetical protein
MKKIYSNSKNVSLRKNSLDVEKRKKSGKNKKKIQKIIF